MIRLKETDFAGGLYPCRIELDGFVFPSAENAFQSAKFLDHDKRASFQYMTAYQASYRGPRMRPEISCWDGVRLGVMLEILRLKFSDPDLKSRLMGLDGPVMIENMRHENYWGACQCRKCRGRGANNLGKLLCSLRSDLLETG